MNTRLIQLTILTAIQFGCFNLLIANEIQNLICEAGKNFGQAVARAHIAVEFKSANMGAQRQAMFDNLDNAVRFVSEIESAIPEPFATIRKDNNYARLISNKVEQLKSKWDGLPLHQRVNEVNEIYGVYLGSLRYTYNTDRPDVIQQKPTCDSKIIQVCYDFGMAMIASETVGDPERPLFVEQYHQRANSEMRGDIDAGLNLAMDPGHRPFNGHSEKICCGFGAPDAWEVFPRFTSESPIVAYLSAEIIQKNIITNANPSQECASGVEHCVSYDPQYYTDSGPPIPPDVDYFNCWDTGNPNWFKPSYMTDGCSYSHDEFIGGATIYLNIGVFHIHWRRQYGEMDLNAMLGGPKAPDHCNPELEPVRTVQIHRIADPRKEYTYTHPTKAIYVIFRPDKRVEDLGRRHYAPLAIRYMKQIEPYAMNCSGDPNSNTAVSNANRGLTPLIPLEFKFDFVRFFESGRGSTAMNQRQYASRFPASEVRYMNWELHIDYEKVAHNREPQIFYILYNEHNKVIRHGQVNVNIEPGSDGSHHTTGYGWENPGNWRPGDYAIQFWAYGKKAGEATFAIIDDLPEGTSGSVYTMEDWANALQVKHVKFYEGPSGSVKLEDRTYQQQFNTNETRYIKYELNLSGPAPNQPIDLPIEYVITKPNGSELYRHDYIAQVQESWKGVITSRGYGSKYTGTWADGAYTVHLYANGKHLASESFTVYGSDAMRSKEEWLRDLKRYGLKLFESEKDLTPLDDRMYKTVFESASTRYICFEIEIGSPSPSQEMHFSLAYVFSDQQGDEIYRNTIDCNYLAGSPSRYYAFGYGNRSAGEFWKPGAYKVEIFVEGTAMGTANFIVQ